MDKVMISVDEFKRLTELELRYEVLLQTIKDASSVYIPSWEGSKPYLKLEDDEIINTLKIIEKDKYDEMYTMRLKEAEEREENDG